MSIFKSYDEMDASHRAAFDLGRTEAEQRIEELEAEVAELDRMIELHAVTWLGLDPVTQHEYMKVYRKVKERIESNE